MNYDPNNQQFNNGFQQNAQPIDSQAKAVDPNAKSDEEKKNISRKRIFWAIAGVDIALAIFLVYEIISLFF